MILGQEARCVRAAPQACHDKRTRPPWASGRIETAFRQVRAPFHHLHVFPKSKLKVKGQSMRSKCEWP